MSLNGHDHGKDPHRRLRLVEDEDDGLKMWSVNKFGIGFMIGVAIVGLIVLFALNGCTGHIEDPISEQPSCAVIHEGCIELANRRYDGGQFASFLYYIRVSDCAENLGLCVSTSSVTCHAGCKPAFAHTVCDDICRWEREQ